VIHYDVTENDKENESLLKLKIYTMIRNFSWNSSFRKMEKL